MADKLYNEASIQAIANAIRAKSGKTDTMKVSEMAGEIAELGDYTIDDIAMHNYGSGAVVMPTATSILTYTFFNNTAITSISAPNVVTFERNGSVTGQTQGSYVFSGCTNLTTASFPKLRSAGSGGYQFNGCSKLETVYMPVAEFVGQRMFQGCSSLLYILMPNATNTNGTGFSGCSKLQWGDFGDLIRIHTSEFVNCAKLVTLIIRCSQVPTLSNINAFTGTPFASGKTGGTLYVPQSLLSGFESATNWSTILSYENNQILPIEGSIYETQYADGTHIETGGDS